jgi:hypothetical protein
LAQGMVFRCALVSLMLLLIMSAPADPKSYETADMSQDPKSEVAQTQRSVSSMTTMDVEIDIFSGMPNPAWTLSGAQAAAFLAKLAALPETEAKPRSTNLGYRGFIVRAPQGTDQEIYIQRGFVEVRRATASKFFLDPVRSLEQWLLNIGRGRVDKHVLDIIEAEMKK